MNGRGFPECQQPMNNKNTTQAYMYRLVTLYDQHTISTYTHETTMTVSFQNFPIKYSVVTKLENLRNFKINLMAQFRDMWVVVINFFGFASFVKYFTWLLTVVQFYIILE